MKNWKMLASLALIGVGATVTLTACGKSGESSKSSNAEKSSVVSRKESSSDNAGNASDQKDSLSSFSKISIESATSNVTISKDDIDKPFVSYSGNENMFTYDVKDDTLTVKQTGDSSKTESIVITVPQKTDLTSIEAKLSSGDLKLSQLSLNAETIELLSGKLILNNATLNSGTINLSAGNVEAENSTLKNTTFAITAGDFSGKNTTFQNENTLKMTAGEVNITLANKDLKVSTTTVVGDADIASDLNQSSTNTLTIDGTAMGVSIQ